MARKSRKGDRERRRRQHGKLKASFQDLHSKGVYIKRVLRNRGVDLPFYDYYDSYFSEFNKVVADAKSKFPSLLNIVELEDREYFNTDRSSFVDGMQQIFWDSEQEVTGYGIVSENSNISGFTSAFRAPNGEIKTLVILRKSVPKSQPHRENKYVFKLVALLHELGHVLDIEQQLNFNHDAGTFNVIEAEVFAHLHALRRMAERNYYQCFMMLLDALKEYTAAKNYLGDVVNLTLDRMPEYKLIDVNSIPLEPLTAADLEAIGPEGRRAFGLPS